MDVVGQIALIKARSTGNGKGPQVANDGAACGVRFRLMADPGQRGLPSFERLK